MDPNLLLTYVTSGAACAYILRLLQKWNKTPWINEYTGQINIAIRAILSFIATVGISYQWDAKAHVLTIGNLEWNVIGVGLWHWLGQYAMQHGWGQLFMVGNGQEHPPEPLPNAAEAALSGGKVH